MYVKSHQLLQGYLKLLSDNTGESTQEITKTIDMMNAVLIFISQLDEERYPGLKDELEKFLGDVLQ